MFKREIKINFKTAFIWLLILCSIFLLSYLVYPSIMNDKAMLDEMIKMFPEEMLKAFNMDISSINSVFGWFKTEGFTFYILIISVYSAILGSNILLKEESDKTIFYLSSLPISRFKIVTIKVISGFLSISFITVVFYLFNILGMYLSNDLDIKLLTIISLEPLLLYTVIYLVMIFISTYFRNTKNVLPIGIGVVFISYFLNIISLLSKDFEFIKYFSFFTLSDSRYMILHSSVHYLTIIVGLVIISLSLLFTYIRYNRKEFL